MADTIKAISANAYNQGNVTVGHPISPVSYASDWAPSGIQEVDNGLNSVDITEPLDSADEATNNYVGVSGISTLIMAANPGRLSAGLVNNSASGVTISLSDTAVYGSGILINGVGSSYEIIKDNLYTGAISAITNADEVIYLSTVEF